METRPHVKTGGLSKGSGWEQEEGIRPERSLLTAWTHSLGSKSVFCWWDLLEMSRLWSYVIVRFDPAKFDAFCSVSPLNYWSDSEHCLEPWIINTPVLWQPSQALVKMIQRRVFNYSRPPSRSFRCLLNRRVPRRSSDYSLIKMKRKNQAKAGRMDNRHKNEIFRLHFHILIQPGAPEFSQFCLPTCSRPSNWPG